MSANPFSNFDSAYIASLNNSYRDAQVRTNSYSVLPDGKYQTIIDYVALKPSKYYEDELQFIMGFQVLTGDCKGARVSKYTSVVPERIENLKNDLSVLGIDLHDNIVNLGEPETINAILDQIVDITVKQKPKDNGKGFYFNIYINRSHGKAGDNFETVEDDDDNPFDT
jgi:hypothetical protein